MDKIKLAKAILAKQKALAQRDYYEYVKYTHRDIYTYTKHGEFIANTLDHALKRREAMMRGDMPIENQYLMFSLPPRHSKSMTITETLPSYAMAKYENLKVVLTAYSSTLANDFGRANVKKTNQHNVFGVEVETENQERTVYNNGSVCVKAGILGGITGKGAHLMIIDDPIKTAEEANSEVHREKIWKEWISSLSTRLEQAAIVIVIMTRWHEDDLCGRLLNNEYAKPLPWQVINLPLEAEEGDILGRQPGEPLWPERYDYDFIEVRKRYPRDFNSLYQGRPTAEAGNMIKREWHEDDNSWYTQTREFVDNLPILCMSVDATFKDTSKSDKVAIQIWGKLGNDFYLVDAINERMDFLATLQAIRNYCYMYPTLGMKFIEDKANGSAIINSLTKEIHGIVPVNPLGGKEARVQAVLPYMVNNIKLPRNKAFVKPILEEWYSFPYGANDDNVDATSQALAQLMHYYGEKPKTYEDREEDRYANAMTSWKVI